MTEHQAGLFGLKLEEIPAEEIFIWDINWDTFRVFNTLNTQWRIGGMGHATGLDYNVIPSVGKMLGFKNKQINEMFPDLQVMENEALITMGENRKDANNR
ncbi:hypothetical protein vBPpSSYP_143 [Pseudomonas phage vB_PpS_SYP]|nr:hypothetical protein vBPpSSYP_143 [Pseudomonas phage vB_PpS_SYP]